MVKAQAPGEYMDKVKAQVNGEQLRIGEIDSWEALLENLKMNCIPRSIFEMDSGDYDTFLEERRRLIAEKIS
ncbi:hypothetical protein [Evansella tamaricis]|uniref:Uncharacterized protein n=1 Tax=Evansella tamaricis TaxID=2069301 RepID=A0ABS6JA08_9BACI|nr:hypothetical protein [Evansella tamaricis]MBU9710524.1 hypothetical protein [Evansella tamaricis]